MNDPVHIVGSGAVCAIGLNVRQIWAAARAGLSRTASSSVHDRHFEPITMALLPEDVFEPLSANIKTLPPGDAQGRMLRLALPAFRDAIGLAPQVASVAVFVGLPEPPLVPQPASETAWLEALVSAGAFSVDLGSSKVFPMGRASFFFALQAALNYLGEGRQRTVIVGAVDTFLQLRRLAELDAEERLLGERRMNGFIPGEGAAFVVLTNNRANDGLPSTLIAGLGTAMDEGHRYSDKPDKGEGLANAIEAMRATMATPRAPAEVIFAGLNGEGENGKEWGVAQLRHRDLLSPEAMLEHPADRFGDVGAAAGAMLMALADTALLQGHREGPALVWASSDREPVGCAWLDLTP